MLTPKLFELCLEETLHLLTLLPDHKAPHIVLHTLKANAHALGMLNLAQEIHQYESNPIDIPVEAWRERFIHYTCPPKNWDEVTSHLCQGRKETVTLHWKGPELPEIVPMVIQFIRNTVAHGGKEKMQIQVKVDSHSNGYHVEVCDDGLGVASPKPTRCDLHAGRGVGLSIVEKQVQAWGSKLEVSSSADGHKLSFDFPIRKAA